MRKKLIYLVLFGITAMLYCGTTLGSVKEAPSELSEETKECVACHKKNNPGITQQWGASKHYRANVGCYECHAAEEGDPDAYIHDEKKVKNSSPLSFHRKTAPTATKKK